MLETATDGILGCDDLVAGARRVVIAGHPRPMATQVPGTSTVFRPKELLLDLLRLRAADGGRPVSVANPHFMRTTEWAPDLTVVHLSALELTCPVPIARNVQVLDGEDLLGLAEERRLGEREGVRRTRAIFMNQIASVALTTAPGKLIPPRLYRRLRLDSLLADAGLLPPDGARPVQWMECQLETGPYNFLRLRQTPKLQTSHVRVLVDTIARGGRPPLVAFATPPLMGEVCAVLRAFAAMARGVPNATLLVFFFGTPDELQGALNERAHAAFFGDNFACPQIRFLFAPFAAADLLHAIRTSACTIDSSHGGMLELAAEAMGCGNRLVVASDGSFDAWQGGAHAHGGIDWPGLLDPAVLSHRHHKTDRSAERDLVAMLRKLVV